MPGFSASSLVDLERYPIEDLSHQTAVAVIAQAREQLLSSGAAELPGFIHPEGVKTLAEDAAKLALRGHHSQGLGGPYLAPADETFAADHPRRFREAFAVCAVAYDIIPFSSPLRQLYDSVLVLEFISAILNRGALYRYADPCVALNLAVIAAGEQLKGPSVRQPPPGQMGLGTNIPVAMPPKGWTRPAKPDPMTMNVKPRGRSR